MVKSARPPLTSCCVAQLLTGHRLVRVSRPGVGDPSPRGTKDWCLNQQALDMDTPPDRTQHMETRENWAGAQAQVEDTKEQVMAAGSQPHSEARLYDKRCMIKHDKR